ncbi:VOC family protein [Thermaurantiacus tibetensis]|uniref:VOC family protein n=1 Tax=Thermaurantiacus tibetensis TaxID=2759035 RepID=UPI00188F64C6|nr:VOC family protein [Thermaurantiacus tibetensis]
MLPLLIALGIAGPCSAAAAAQPQPVPGPSALWRATFVVSDIAAALAVWRDVLGFRLAYEGGSALNDPRLVRLFGLGEGESARLFVLVSGNTALGNLGFLVPERGAAAPPAGRTASGAPALFVKTTQLEAVVPRLVAAGCTLLAAPEAERTPGRNRMAWLIDPNGIRFVLTERETIELAYPDPR